MDGRHGRIKCQLEGANWTGYIVGNDDVAREMNAAAEKHGKKLRMISCKKALLTMKPADLDAPFNTRWRPFTGYVDSLEIFGRKGAPSGDREEKNDYA